MKIIATLSLWLATPVVTGFVPSTTRSAPSFISQKKNIALHMGILDEVNSDSFDLLSVDDEDSGSSNKRDAAYETFLADLVFSTNDPRVDIVNNLEQATDEDFLSWLNKKVDSSRDPEERTALRDLYEMILEVEGKVEVSRLAEERLSKEQEEQEAKRMAQAEAEAEEGRHMSAADVLKKAAAINTAVATDGSETQEEEKKTFYEEEITPEIRLSYEKMVQKVLPPYSGGDTTESIVFKYYDQFDAQFVKVLTERATNGDQDSKILLAALAVEQQKKIGAAAEVLKAVLALGDPMRMEGAIVKLAREGKIDEPFLLLLEANGTQARDAGAEGAAQLMDKLRNRAAEEKDKQASSKEVRLIRQLLRAEDSAEREKILEDAFTPRDNLLVVGTAENAQKAMEGEEPEHEKPMPDVPPPDFINACKAVLLNFGNLDTDDDRGDLSTRIKQIASEAEVVATRIYGKGMTLREQQDRAWKETTTSIFDLEEMEIEAERMGDRAPWTNPDANDDIIPGFDATGKMKIGGS